VSEQVDHADYDSGGIFLLREVKKKENCSSKVEKIDFHKSSYKSREWASRPCWVQFFQHFLQEIFSLIIRSWKITANWNCLNLVKLIRHMLELSQPWFLNLLKRRKTEIIPETTSSWWNPLLESDAKKPRNYPAINPLTKRFLVLGLSSFVSGFMAG
jgi:hypothetical protein